MSDWENDDFEPSPLDRNIPVSWGDEDQDNVKDSWDQEEEDTPKKAPTKPKKTLQQKIAERAAEEERKTKELEAKRAKALAEANESLEERKEREQKAMLEADLQNAKELFGDLTVQDKKPVLNFMEMNPQSKEDFEAYTVALSEQLAPFKSSAFFPFFVENLTRDLCGPLSLDDTRKISSILSAMINEKQKAFSNKKKKGVATKKAVLKTGSGIDTTNYDADLYAGDYDDFM